MSHFEKKAVTLLSVSKAIFLLRSKNDIIYYYYYNYYNNYNYNKDIIIIIIITIFYKIRVDRRVFDF